jgi:large subunit ribosomal protein L11
MAPPKKKEPVSKIKLQIKAGAANPSPPVGPALGQAGLNIMDFCKAFNERTKGLEGPIPVVINAYKDRSFDFTTKLSPMSYMIKKAAKLKSGSTTPGLAIIGKLTRKQVTEIAEAKMQDLNANDIEAASRMVEGTARSMGIEVVEG